MSANSDTPETDKFYDMVSNREASDGSTPSKWSYEAILDFLDYAKGLERKLARERATWCDKSEDRLYHAADRTWWRRNPKGDCVIAQPPEEIENDRLRAAGQDEDIIAKHSGTTTRREWHSVGSWLYPGDEIVVRTKATEKGKQ